MYGEADIHAARPKPELRSLERITADDLVRLGEIAAADRADLFARRPACAGCELVAVALCQGAALHYLDGITGIKNFDVWSFYREDGVHEYCYHRRGKADFGDSKFGQSDGFEPFIGRRVDLLGRTIKAADVDDPVRVLRGYLRSGKRPREGKKGSTPWQLAQRAVILIEPRHLLGTVVWPA